MGHGRHWVDSKSLRRTKNEFLHYFASMKQEVNAMCMVWLGGRVVVWWIYYLHSSPSI